jgi:coiled-coil domain-containing protein 55
MKVNPLIGQKGQKYGLIKAQNLFQVNDEDNDVNSQIRKDEFYKQNQIKVQRKNADILSEDPMAFAYDEVYDEMKKTNAGPGTNKNANEPKKPKYVHALLKQAHERERNDNLIFQHKLQNELEAEKKLFGDDFKEYVTPSYVKLLAENKKYADKLKKRDEMDDKNDVTKQRDLSSFYRNLEKNVAFGGKQDDSSEEEKDEVDESRRSPSPDTKMERAKRKRERAEDEMVEAKRLKEAREDEKIQKQKALQEEFAKHQTEKEEVDEAKVRFLERKKKKEEELAKLRAMAHDQ